MRHRTGTHQEEMRRAIGRTATINPYVWMPEPVED
jgi:hypothetical protein